MEEDDANPKQGGGSAAGIRIIFLSRDAGGSSLQIGDLGSHPTHGKFPGGVSGPGGETADGASRAAET